MKTLARWGKFNLVGVMGMVAQLGSLAVLNRIVPGHYLAASAVALELTLLHNFVWHVHYTWRERRETATLPGQCVRFHLSNGMVSLAGNLALVKVLVADARLPVVAANGIAILCCSLVNFSLGETWVFGTKPFSPKQVESGGCPRCEQGNGSPGVEYAQFSGLLLEFAAASRNAVVPGGWPAGEETGPLPNLLALPVLKNPPDHLSEHSS